MLSKDYWEGFYEALTLMESEVDKILNSCYTDNRSTSREADQILDVRVKLHELKRMAPHYEVKRVP